MEEGIPAHYYYYLAHGNGTLARKLQGEYRVVIACLIIQRNSRTCWLVQRIVFVTYQWQTDPHQTVKAEKQEFDLNIVYIGAEGSVPELQVSIKAKCKGKRASTWHLEGDTLRFLLWGWSPSFSRSLASDFHVLFPHIIFLGCV